MNLNWLTLSLFIFRVYNKTSDAFNINIKQIFRTHNEQDVKMIKKPQQVSYYYEDWSSGEVEWEFARDKDMNTYTFVVPEKTYLIKNTGAPVSIKNKKPLAVRSGIVQALYDDIVRIETFVYQVENIDYGHYLSEASLSEAISLAFIGVISYLYKNGVKSEMNIIRKQKMGIVHKPITLQEIDDYLKFQKLVKTFMIMFLFIFTKNVKNAE